MRIPFNVFGKAIIVERIDNKWLAFADSGTGKMVRVHDMAIPPDLEEHELAGYLADVYHEYATERYPSVTRLD